MPQILCLHGAFNNPKIMQQRMDAFFSGIEEQGKISFLYPRGPFEMSLDLVTYVKGVDRSMWVFPDPPNYCWTNNTNIDIQKLGYAQPGMRVTAKAVDEAIDYLEEQIIPALGPIDGVVAQSESSMVATRLAQRHKSIKCAIIFNGVASTDESMTGPEFAPTTDAGRIPIYSLHIYGRKDMFQTSAATMHSFYDQDKARLLQHTAGHTIPQDPKNQTRIRNAVTSFLDAVDFDAERT